MVSKKNPVPKIVASLILFFAGFLIWDRNLLEAFQSPEIRFVHQWERDFKLLEKSHSLHAGISRVKFIEYFPTTEKLKKLVDQKNTPKFPVHADGKFKLEIFLDEIDSGEGIVIQYDLVDLNSGNTVWELGRTLKIKLQN